MNKTEYVDKILNDRKNKDDFFKNHPQSPIPIKDKNQFEGLDYYEPDMNYKFILELKEMEEKELIKVNDSGGNVRDMLIWGEFHFKIGNTECSLQAYKSEAVEERLFVPFKDKTSGKETYGAGKYLDLIYEKDQTEDGKWILDFNNATNPWCAYSENYACPFVPPANWLNIKVLAGEKNYPLGHYCYMPKIEPFEKHLIEYEKWFDKYLPVYQSELLAIKSIANVHENAVEIGIGSGLFAKPLGIKRGIDPSWAMIQKAKERGLQVNYGIAENLPWDDNSIDYALMVTTICFVDDPLKSISEVYRILKPNGIFVIGFVDKDSQVGEQYLKYKNTNIFYKDATFFSIKEILSFFKEIGLKKEKILQTVFGRLDEIKKTQKSVQGFGKGSFVVILGKK